MPFVEYDENEAVCPQCGSSFRSPEILEAHVRDSHAAPADDGTGTENKRVRCSVCGASFASLPALVRHNRTAHVT